MMRHRYLLPLLFVLISSLPALAQTGSIQPIDVSFHDVNGIRFMTQDSSSAMHLRFRMQNRVELATESGSDADLARQSGLVRRLRLRTSGYLKSQKLTYNLQLGFSPSDMDLANSPNPQIILDAVVFYRFLPALRIGFGQTKLPGNRQRVISSGEQQFVDRSIVNSTFNLDRDFGFHGSLKESIGNVGVNLLAAVTTGDGRNTFDRGVGLAYTVRGEVLPFGKFKYDGDYFEGDWAFEETPKLSIGGMASYNENATRTGGQIGRDLFSSTDIRTYELDALLKYQGIAFYTEYMNRDATRPLTFNPDFSQVRYVLTGYGLNTQLSYQFRNHFEIGGRYAFVKPNEKVDELALQTKEYTLVGNYYYRWHRIKLQSDLTYQERENLTVERSNRDAWIWRFQVELGI
ncbi:porin [Adhaeribacter soli]|uniref:Porin n=1 Tax=Adhaeribacter soli TaxID=2607655 RepID=A0A5N1IVD4_9BACT|nr:porin [Adhaeribacter soli]KAA9333728.1 porin [Adhaeribacter soli]